MMPRAAVLLRQAASVRDPRMRRAFGLSLRAALSPRSSIFQPFNDTFEDRYPEVFENVNVDESNLSILSFGCSTGAELAALREHFPGSIITGIDASRANVVDARRRMSGDSQTTVKRADTTHREPAAGYDLILAMAVFRHGALGRRGLERCSPLIHFEQFDEAITDMIRCLRPQGKLVVEHSNFRVRDTRSAHKLRCVWSRPVTAEDSLTPHYDRKNRKISDVEPRREVIFELETSPPVSHG